MSKKNPFFKFDAADWLGGSIQFLGFAEKGLFIDLCAMYWKTQEPVKIDGKFKVRCRCDEGTLRSLIGTLSDLELITESTKGITVPLMDRLMGDRQQWLKKCSDSGKKSARNKGTSSNKKEERRKEKEESRKKIVDKYDPLTAIVGIDGIDPKLWQEWVTHKKKLKLAVTERALNGNINKIKALGLDNANTAIAQSIDAGWKDIYLKEENIQQKEEDPFGFMN